MPSEADVIGPVNRSRRAPSTAHGLGAVSVPIELAVVEAVLVVGVVVVLSVVVVVGEVDVGCVVVVVVVVVLAVLVAVVAPVAWVVVAVVVDRVVFFAFDDPPKKVVGCPLPVMELPAIRSGIVKTPRMIAKATRPVTTAIHQRGRQALVSPDVAGVDSTGVEGSRPRTAGTLGTFLAVAVAVAVAVTVRIGRRRTSETRAMITGAAAAPNRVPGPQIRATANDAAADARLATISVCSEIPLRGLRLSGPSSDSGHIRRSPVRLRG
jgi:predicted pyridoxine 5'-phosphate oxidase superfamily flavin-nucleotide-binding protein